MVAADYRIMTDATGQRIATALEAQSIDKAAKTDLTSIIATGTTNTTGATITVGTYFYLNGTLVQALTYIASGATFTSGTNYEVVTAGGLNSINDKIVTQSATVAKANANYTYGNVTFEKTSNYVRVMIEGFVSLPTQGYTNICSIPSGFAPSGTKYFDVIIGTDESGANLRILRFKINTTTLSVYNYSTELTNANAQPIVTYIR